MNGVKKLKFGTDEYTIEDLLARESLNTKVSKTLKNQTLTLNGEIELYLWNGYKDFTITAGTFLRAEYIDYKLDNDEWVTVNLDQEGYPYTIDVTGVQVITLKGGGASIYPITLTCDLISDTEGLPSHSSTDNGKFLRVNAQGNAEWVTDNKQDILTAGANINIDENNVISADKLNSILIPWDLTERDSCEMTYQKYVGNNQTIGQPVTYSISNQHYVAKVVVEPNTLYYFLCEDFHDKYNATGYNAQYSARFAVFTDENDNFLEGYSYPASYYDNRYLSPPTAKYLYVTFNSLGGTTILDDHSNLGYYWITSHAENDHVDEERTVASLFELEGNVEDLNSSVHTLQVNQNNLNPIQLIRKPTFSFIFDDGTNGDVNVKALFDSYGYKCGFAILSTITGERYLNYQADGYEILSHSTDGTAFSDISDLDVAETKLQTSIKTLKSKGYDITGWVTPSTSLLPSQLPLVKKYYQYGFGWVNNTTVTYIHTMSNSEIGQLERWSLQSHTLTETKAKIDECIANNGLLIFYGHSYPSTEDYMTEENMIEILDYIKSFVDDEEAKVLVPREAINGYFMRRQEELDLSNYQTLLNAGNGIDIDDSTISVDIANNNHLTFDNSKIITDATKVHSTSSLSNLKSNYTNWVDGDLVHNGKKLYRGQTDPQDDTKIIFNLINQMYVITTWNDTPPSIDDGAEVGTIWLKLTGSSLSPTIEKIKICNSMYMGALNYTEIPVIPMPALADAGKLLQVNSQGKAEWVTDNNEWETVGSVNKGMSGTSVLLDFDDITIPANNDYKAWRILYYVNPSSDGTVEIYFNGSSTSNFWFGGGSTVSGKKFTEIIIEGENWNNIDGTGRSMYATATINRCNTYNYGQRTNYLATSGNYVDIPNITSIKLNIGSSWTFDNTGGATVILQGRR